MHERHCWHTIPYHKAPSLLSKYLVAEEKKPITPSRRETCYQMPLIFKVVDIQCIIGDGYGKRTRCRKAQQSKNRRLLRCMYKTYRRRKGLGPKVRSQKHIPVDTISCMLYNGCSIGKSVGTGISSSRVFLSWWWNSCQIPFRASMRSLASKRSSHLVLCSFSTCHGSPSVGGKVLWPWVRISRYRLWTRRWRIETWWLIDEII